MPNITMPILPKIPGCMRDTKEPAIGAVIRVARGQGVNSNPVITSLCPNVFCKKKGSEIMANICAVNEQMEVIIESLKIGIFNKSKGNNGVS